MKNMHHLAKLINISVQMNDGKQQAIKPAASRVKK